MTTTPTNPNPLDDVNGSDELYNTELLDLLQSSEDDAALTAMSKTEPHRAGLTTEGPRPVVRDNFFLVGGSLFTHRPAQYARPSHSGSAAGPSSSHQGHFTRTSPRLPQSNITRQHASVFLTFGSLFCPFTQQFFSLRSPHWQHLQRAGFGIHTHLRSGRRIDLIYPGLLYRVARELRGVGSRSAGQISYASPNVVAKATTSGWSPLLMSTLGAVLKEAPIDSLEVFKQWTRRHLKTDTNGPQARQIPLGFACSQSRHDASAATRELTYYLNMSAGLDGARTPRASPSHSEHQSGQQWLHHAAAARVVHLQISPEFSLCRNLPARSTTSICVIGTGGTHAATSTAASDSTEANAPPPPPGHATVPAWQQRWCASNTSALQGMPLYTRVAWLHVPLPQRLAAEHHATIMHDVSGAFIDHYLTDSCRPHTTADGVAPKRVVLFCPIEHAIDYNSVLDVVAYRVHLDASQSAHAWLSTYRTDPKAEALPILSLGFSDSDARAAWSDPMSPSPDPDIDALVIVSNAHFLSRRAVSRMLDQWTRNGAARRLHRERRGHGQRREPDAHLDADNTRDAVHRRFAWHTLLGLDPFASPIRRRYLMPFGTVRALFLALEVDGAVPDGVGAGAGEVQSVCAPGGVVKRIRLTPTSPRHSVFHLNEPLSATLLRVGPLFRTRLTHEEQLSFLQFLATRARELLPGQVLCARRGDLATMPGQATVISEQLDSADGIRMFRTGCEALLMTNAENNDSTTSPAMHLQSVERVLAAFPFLSAITCAHHLVDAFRLQLEMSEEGSIRDGDGRPRTDRRSVKSAIEGAPETDAHTSIATRPAGPLTPVVVATRHDAYEREERETIWRARSDHASRIAHASSLASRFSALGQAGSSQRCDNAAPILTSTPFSYASVVEPPLLLGRWTRTLFFCAPIVADVLPLRALLHARLAARLARRQDGAHGVVVVVVHDVDIFHIDYVAFSLARRCRLFGIRVWFDEKSDTAQGNTATNTTEPSAGRLDNVNRLMDDLLQRVLRQYATDPVFFPLWTYESSPQSAIQPRASHADSSAPPDSYAFSSTPEWATPATPTLVERRLLAMAAAQYPFLRLARGSRIVLHSPVTCGQGPHGDPEMLLPAGTVCVVTDFVPLPSSQQMDTNHELSDADTRAVRLYERQQKTAALCLPMVRPLFVPRSPTSAEGLFTPTETVIKPFHLLPRPQLVGGFRSVHYYSLPLLHLPCHVLAGGDAKFTSSGFIKQRRAMVPSQSVDAWHITAPEDVAFAFPASFLFHPYYGGQTCKTRLCLTTAHRQHVFDTLFSGVRAGTDVRLPAPSFFEDTVVQEFSHNGNSSSTPRKIDGDGAAKDNAQSSSADAKATLWDPFLTELALFRAPLD